MTINAIVPWNGPEGISIPSSKMTVGEIVPYAAQLTESDRTKIIKAFEFNSFDMASEFVWRRTMSKLKTTLSSLGMAFIGEMLDRPDISDSSAIETVLTDYDAIRLAEHLGVISPTGAMQLRHAFETLSHFSAPQTTEELGALESSLIIKNSIKFVLGDEDTYIPVDFKNIRRKLTSETINKKDPQLLQLIDSPAFYISTALRILISSIKNNEDTQLEIALNNINSILKDIWPRLTEQDRFLVGATYAQVASQGKTTAMSGLKNALLKVNGFDYVPETIRSVTYKQVAKSIIDAHFSFSNYNAEPAPTKRLADLGTSIPKSALPECLQAVLCIYLGNRYGHSFSAAPIAESIIKSISYERWQYYIDKVFHTDQIILEKITQKLPQDRFFTFIKNNNLCDITPQDPNTFKLIRAICAEKISLQIVSSTAKDMLSNIGKNYA
ncbi:MAG: hypothetical protein LHW64_11735 [Candidatus Cloacimonetes bacterium]|nr:hypothetical protein [Candidatus Cloacimonadota bacterium]MDY0230754.1 hypothetical protein [Candidatus Cloacimonadaceae bacterium]